MEPDFKNMTPEQQRQLLFASLIQQHEQLAMMGMGKLKNPATDEISTDLRQARFMIDTLEALQHYTKGQLEDELSRYLQHVLNTLRLNYADSSK